MNSLDGYKNSVAEVTALPEDYFIGEDQYTLAAIFQADRSGFGTVVTGIADVVSRDGDYVVIECRRAFQNSHYTKTLGPGDSSEVVHPVLMGGNVALPIEPEVAISYANPEFARGLKAGSRARAGHGFEFGGRLFTLAEATAFAAAPDAVTFGHDSPQVSVSTTIIDCSGIRVEKESWAKLLFFQDAGATPDPRSDCRATWRRSSDGASGECTARTFEDYTLTDAPYYYPPAAMFGTAVAEYHVALDGASYVFRFSISTFLLNAADDLEVSAYSGIDQPGEAAFPEGAASPIVVLPVAFGSAGYVDGSDELIGGSTPLQGAIDNYITWEYGEGSLEIRQKVADPASPFVACLFGDGGLTEIKWRESQGGLIHTAAVVGGSHGGEFDIRALWTGTTVEFFHRNTGDTPWTSAGTARALVNTEGGGGNICAWEDVGLRVRNVTWGMTLLNFAATGSLWCRYTTSYGPDGETPRAFQIVPKPSSEPITEVFNVTANVAMGLYTGDVRRNTYGLDGSGHVIVPGEADGDEIRVTCQAPVTAEGGTGRPPRVFGQSNWATDDGTGQATTDVSENRANFRDRLRVHDPRALLTISAGQAFRIVTYPVFSSLDPPTLQFSVRKASGTAAWANLPADSWLAYWPDGLVLLRYWWTDSLSLAPGETICIRALGKVVRGRALRRAHHYLDIARMVNCLDQAHVAAGIDQGEAAIERAGTFRELMHIVAEGWEGVTIETVGPGSGTFYFHKRPTGLAWGMAKSDSYGYANAMDAASWPGFPYWVLDALDDLAFTMIDSNLRSAFLAADAVTSYYPDIGTPNHVEWTDHDVCVPEEFFFGIRGLNGPSGLPLGAYGENWRLEGGIPTYDPTPSRDNFFGGYVGLQQEVNGGDGIPGSMYGGRIGSEFSIKAIPFDLDGMFTGLPDGAEIVTAHLKVKFDGFRTATWANRFELVAVPTIYGHSQVDAYSTYSREGETVREDSLVNNFYTSETVPLFPDPASSGAITFVAMGKLKDSKQVELIDGTFHAANRDRLVAIGAALSIGDVADGEWAIIDVKGVIQRIVDDRDSKWATVELWPSPGSSVANASPDGEAGYLKTLLPEHEIEGFENVDDHWSFVSTCSGSYSWFSSLEVGSLHVTYRMPSGLIFGQELPIHQPALIPAP